MDGDNRRLKHHDPSRSWTSSGGIRRGVPRSAGGVADRFRQHDLISARGNQADLVQVTEGSRMPAYVDYGYTDTAFQGNSLHGDELQPYSVTLREQHQQHQQQQQRPPPVQQSYAPYDSEMVYNLSQQGPTTNAYEVVPQYSTRQSAAMDALSSQFAVPQYFSANEPTATGVPADVSPYLTSHLSSSAYNQPGPIGRSSAMQPFPATMSEFTAVGTDAGRLDQQQPPPQSQQHQGGPESTDEAYGRFQRALRATFDHTRAGRLVEASRSMLEISEWLVTNARELDILRDDPALYPDRLQLWNNFNICWLAICQKQKDMTQDLLHTGRQSPNTTMLPIDRMEEMGRDLIQFCDQMEQHGLVDYQMGIWEEEILGVLGECLDLLENRPDDVQAYRGSAAAVTTSRS